MPAASVRSRLRRTWRLLVKELGAFGVVGAACFVLDLALFQLLYTRTGVGAVGAKLLASLVSMSVAFLGHRFWSFSHRARTGLRREYVLFFLVNGIALAVSLLMIAAVRYPLGQDSALALQVTNVASIGVGSLLRFTLYRRWVFIAPATDGPATASLAPAAAAPEVMPPGASPLGR